MSTLEFGNNFDGIHQLLFSYAIKLTRNVDDAKDLVQETACRAYKNRLKFRLGTNFKAWSKTIMRNIFINDYRKKSSRNMKEEPLEAHLFALESKEATEKSDSPLHWKELNAVIEQVEPSQRQPFMLYYKGYAYDEIAEMLQIPVGTVKSRIYFARKKMKSLILQFYRSV